ncbi:MAG: hypothetical protein U5M23_15125 [Marinagarivorans sp.]|nr:hypothetical protein [Marinagarivorans sp.]
MQKPLTTKQQFWLDHITAAQHNGQSLSDYAADHDLNLKALYNWRWTFSKRDLHSSAKNSSFVKIVPPTNIPAVVHPPIIAMLPNGVRLQFEVLTTDILALLRTC